MNITKTNTKPYLDQKLGTSGIRKKIAVFKQKNYLENFLQSSFNILNMAGKNIVLGGDGRHFNKEAIEVAINMLVAAKAKTVYVGLNCAFSTPAISHFIKKNSLDFGFIFSASHNPAGISGDFGIKINGKNGSGINTIVSNKIYEETKNIEAYYKIDSAIDLDFSKIREVKLHDTIIKIIDPIKDYSNYMEEIFNFEKIRSYFKTNNLVMKYEAFNAVTGIYSLDIFHNKLGFPLEWLKNTGLLEDFGGRHADPNPFYAKDLIALSKSRVAPDIILASDGDGDRAMILGKDTFISPCDSLAVILYYSHLLPFYNGKVKGVARSFVTSGAVDLVAKKLNVPCFEVPVGWKFFGNLLESHKITFCGEESFGAGSNHLGEKDGLWSCLFWLNIMAETGKSVKEIIENLWQEFGRCYYTRMDYEDVDSDNITALNSKIEAIKNNANLIESELSKDLLSVENFAYTDSVTGETVEKEGYVFKFKNDKKFSIRVSGTSSSGNTVRTYSEVYKKDYTNSNLAETKEITDFISKLTGLKETIIY